MANTWGTNYWGVNSFGAQDDVTLTLSGLSVSTSIGSSTIQADANVVPTTLSLSITIPGVVAGASALVSPTGVTATIVTGNETTGLGVPVTGSQINSSSGSVTIDDRYLIGSGWGRDVWGGWAWGVNYSVLIADGVSITATTGNEDAFTDYTQEITVSFGLTTQTNSVDIQADGNISVNVAEHTINTNIQSVSIVGNALVQPTGSQANANVGSAEAGLKTEVPVTGIQINAYSGNEDAIGNANVSVTGNSITGSAGQAGYIAGYNVTGSVVTGSVGQVTVIGQAKVIPTGIGLTVNTITPNIIAWAEVDTGTSVVWTPVDLAA